METYYPTDSGRDILVLLIEDEKVSRKALGKLLASEGYTTETVGSAEEALAVLEVGQRPHVALVDLDLPGMSGAELLIRIAQKAFPIEAVLVTAASEERVRRLTDSAPVQCIRKPIDFQTLLRTLERLPASN